MERVPWIAVAVLIQLILRRVHRLTGAIFGVVVTTAILGWGMQLYSQGYEVGFFFVPLPQPLFVLACVGWYGLDGYEFYGVSKERETRKAQTLQVEELKQRQDAEGLVNMLWTLDDHVIAKSRAALKELQSPKAMDLLIAALGDEKPGVKLMAVETLGELGDPRAIEPLRSLEKDPNPMLQAFATIAVKKLQSGASKAV